MGEPRKVFRIEQTAAARQPDWFADGQNPAGHAELMAQFTELHASLAAFGARPGDTISRPQAADTARLSLSLDRLAGTLSAGHDDRAASVTRIAYELAAVVSGTEQATRKVLAAAEAIDQLANNLSAALNGKLEQGAAQDIRDFVIQIFEACNFQDLAGQRISKVMGTLQIIEDQLGRLLDEFKNAATAARRDGAPHLHGPRLDIDAGHASQCDIDALFEPHR